MTDPVSSKSSDDSQLRDAPRKRRRFTPDDKLRIMEEAKACHGRGQLSALLRREGISHSHLTAWRRRLQLLGTEGLASSPPGPKAQSDLRDQVIEKQQREIVELERKLAIVTRLVEMQKKAQEILGMAHPRIEECSRPD